MELSQEKTLITHSNEPARFLGYDVRVRRDQQVKPWKNCKQRTMNNTVELLIPLKDKVEKYLFNKGAVKQRADNGKLKACRCELCSYEGKDKKYEVHHVNKVKNLKGKEPWEVVMIAKRRKTLVVCHDCHQKIHHGF